MGILNVTPDSFSDGGKHNTPKTAIKRAFEMQKQGADIIDIGGESTRPGAEQVSAEEQINRIIPVIKGIRERDKQLLISIDSTNYHVAEAAIKAGANWINDISAGEDDDRILTLAAEKNIPIVLMHRQGKSNNMQDNPVYDDVCKEVIDYLQTRVQQALDMGVAKDNTILDPGIGFGKLLEHNLQLLAGLDSLVALGYPVLLGTSRKRFLGEILNEDDPDKRMIGTCATTALGVNASVGIFRVHDVLENKQAMEVAWQIRQAI